jgi:hypothetical protein
VFSILADFEIYLARWAKGPYEVTGYDPPSLLAGNGVAGPVRFQKEYQAAGSRCISPLSRHL